MATKKQKTYRISGAAEGEAMSTELTGRALDEAAARAMGWTFITFPDGPCPDVKHWKHPAGCDEYHWRPTPPLSADPAHIPEMLAWLLENYDFKKDGQAVTLRASPGVAEAAVWNGGWNSFRGGDGATISEALARLVVAVAEAKR